MPGYHVSVVAIPDHLYHQPSRMVVFGYSYLVSTARHKLASYEWWFQPGSRPLPALSAVYMGSLRYYVRRKNLLVRQPVFDRVDLYGFCRECGFQHAVLYYFMANHDGGVDCYEHRVGSVAGCFVHSSISDISAPVDWYRGLNYTLSGIYTLPDWLNPIR